MTLDFLTDTWLHPGLVLILAAWILPLLQGWVKRTAMVALPAAAMILCLRMTAGTYGEVSFLGFDVVFGRVDQLSLIFSYVFSIMALLGMIYALHVEDDSQHVTALTYAGGALGVTFAGDFISLYIFWELMAISSTLLVWQRREPAAGRAGFRYLLVHIVGGLILLAQDNKSYVLHGPPTIDAFSVRVAFAANFAISDGGVPPPPQIYTARLDRELRIAPRL